VPFLLDYRELLKRNDVEAVSITLPLTLNYEVTAAALKAGKHVLVEKPLAANLPQARRMLELDKRFPGVKLLAENYRYRNLFIRAKQFIDEGKIGRPYGVVWNIFHHVDPKYNEYAQTGWRIHHQYPGGFVTDGGVHNVAALRLLFGDITSGSAVARAVNPAIGEIDTFLLSFSTTTGVNGQLNFFYSAKGYRAETLYALGNKGTMIIENGLITIKSDGFAEQKEEITDHGGFYEEFEDFYYAIRSARAVKSTFREGYNDLRVILTSLKSAQNGRKFVLR
jgi:predicted dehydrogenase